LALAIVVDYFAAILIEKNKDKKKSIFLLVSIISTCLILFVFKYYNFFTGNLTNLANFLGWNYSLKTLSLVLPIGLSFHTFQSLSYVIEVYRGRQKVEKNFMVYSLYVMFYPQLVAGPIERPYNLLHQFYEKHKFEYERVVDGLKLMLWGLFLKAVIADRLAIVVNTIYNNPANYTGIPLILATIFFAFQIFCDFAGYSTIAIGAARVMGFKLMQNFNRPYLSSSISEFWRRWHISLSTWFRDYVYIPLGGNRVRISRFYFNLFIVFLISGLWHGANWTFIIWGALHGFYMVSSYLTTNLRKKLVNLTKIDRFPIIYRFFKIIFIFVLVCIAWIFFRANSLSDAFYILTHLFSGISFSKVYIGIDMTELILSIGLIVFLMLVHLIQDKIDITNFISKKPLWVRWGAYLAVALLILFLSAGGTKFIYFQF
ncbi:MAG: MBOAT family O-acyltransferase, partial [archaeon]